jgi:hypothetical protein
MNVDYPALEEKILDGTFRSELEEELIVGFRAMRLAGDPLPLPSYYASQIAEIVNRGAPVPLRPELAYEVYQVILAACEYARETVLSDP